MPENMRKIQSMQLVSYIAPGAPAARRPATGDEPFLRPEIGFTPNWYRQHLDIDFGERYHRDIDYRKEVLQQMKDLLHDRFGWFDPMPQDLLTGTFGACTVGAIYGLPLVYAEDNWPNCEHQYLTAAETEKLQPPDLSASPFFQRLLNQVESIASVVGSAAGYINWQGMVNNAQRLRGPDLFLDLVDAPDRCRHLFDCICTTMTDAAEQLFALQAKYAFATEFFTVSNCSVNMLSPAQYEELLLPFDVRLVEHFGCLGIHNCAWTADPYLELYARVPNVGYIDMGLESDLSRARELFPNARRALMYTPMDLANKKLDTIKREFERIAGEYGPCDLVLADIEAGTPAERVKEVLKLCEQY